MRRYKYITFILTCSLLLTSCGSSPGSLATEQKIQMSVSDVTLDVLKERADKL